ncbi:unnamed protein product, partial [Phaeothamnion confervicola]
AADAAAVVADGREESPSFPVEAFESMLNVTTEPGLTLVGEALGTASSQQALAKLRAAGDEYLMTPRLEGGAIGISLPRRPDLVLTGVRVLVGAASMDHVPRELRIMGRVRRTAEGQKRWYDLPLTAAEVGRAAAGAPVVLSISSSYEGGNHPLLDAIEVYAQP